MKEEQQDKALELEEKIVKAYLDREINLKNEARWERVVDEFEDLLDESQKTKFKNLLFFWSIYIAGEVFGAIEFVVEYLLYNNFIKD